MNGYEEVQTWGERSIGLTFQGPALSASGDGEGEGFLDPALGRSGRGQ